MTLQKGNELWRKAVLERDDFICQKRGEPESKTAHHIKPFKTHPELRFEIENGQTLCEPCHKEIHFGGD